MNGDGDWVVVLGRYMVLDDSRCLQKQLLKDNLYPCHDRVSNTQ